MRNYFFFAVCIVVGVSLSAQDTAALSVPHQLADNSNRILIINSFDAMSLPVRKNKKELFHELADKLKSFLAHQIHKQLKIEAIIEPGLVPEAVNFDSVAFDMMKRQNLSRLIVIKEIDVYFEQTGVEVVKEEGSKKRTASYDICSRITYAFYSDSTKKWNKHVLRCKYFTKRAVASGLLAVGPDVVGKRKHAIFEVGKNAEEYVWQLRRMLLDK